jgi:hypothetical protein
MIVVLYLLIIVDAIDEKKFVFLISVSSNDKNYPKTRGVSQVSLGNSDVPTEIILHYNFYTVLIYWIEKR